MIVPDSNDMCSISTITHHQTLRACNKAVAVRASVCNEHVKSSTQVENDTIRSRRAPCKDVEGGQNGKLLPWTVRGKVELFVVIVFVRVVVCMRDTS